MEVETAVPPPAMEGVAKKNIFDRDYVEAEAKFQPKPIEDILIPPKEMLTVTIPPLVSRQKKFASAGNGFVAYVHGPNCRIACRAPSSAVFSLRLEPHDADIVDFSWCPMKESTGMAMLGSTAKDGKVKLSFMGFENDEEGNPKAMKLIATQNYGTADFVPGSDDYYTNIRIGGNPYSGHVALWKRNSPSSMQTLVFKVDPKFATFEGGIPPKPDNWDELPDGLGAEVVDDQFVSNTFVASPVLTTGSKLIS
mmetsp:Transcript_18632/g.74893  ORF Transcript_18632/g.74893 Transcript_18632/m.74893 type:complete len:252 (+) Transcript_18632:37-792(+)